MLEYLFNFLTKYIFLVFLAVLILGTASAFSKKIKILFLTILTGAALYFALLCLYRLGIGIKPLYEFSCSVIFYICNNIEKLEIKLFNSELIFTRIFTGIINHPLNSLTSFMRFIFLMIMVVGILVLIPMHKLNIKKSYKLKDYFKQVIILDKKVNNIKNDSNLFIINLVFRC